MTLRSGWAWRITVTVALAAVVSAAIQTPPHTGTARACVLDVITLKTIRVDAATAKKTYGIGDVVEVTFEVTRPGKEDAVGLGLPVDSPVSSPAEAINVGAALSIGDEYLYGHGEPTDENGRSTAKIELLPPIPRDEPAHLAAVAWKTQVQGPCFIVVEHGSVKINNAFVTEQ